MKYQGVNGVNAVAFISSVVFILLYQNAVVTVTLMKVLMK